MIPQPLALVTEAHLQTLIANRVREGKTIEYKRQLPGTSDADKKEFLADISSFANTVGGDLIFGIEEDQGLPTHVVALGPIDIDFQLQRLDNIIAAGLEPRIRYTARAVSCTTGDVVILRVDKSWIGPHRVVFAGHDKFYGRNSIGKYPLDVNELRAAFTLSTTVKERIRAFRTDRIIAISNGDTPVPCTAEPKIVLHCIPLESLADGSQIDILRFHANPQLLPPMRASFGNSRINLDGVILLSSHDDQKRVFSYTQVYRTGVIEAVNSSGLVVPNERLIPSFTYEDVIVRYLPFCLKALQELGFAPPIVVALTLVNVRGLRMSRDARHEMDTGSPIDRDILVLPETIVEDLATPADKILKPLLDLVWNACGYPESQNFDANGNWKLRR